MVTATELESTFKEVGNYFGYGNVTAAFAPFRDLKVKWRRSMDFADFSVSDYLREAPVEVIEGIARTIMSRICGEEYGYTEEVTEWLTSPEFRAINQSKYIERSRQIAVPTDDGILERSYRRLIDEGLIDEIEDLRIFWSKPVGNDDIGQSSCLMRVAILNPRLKGNDVPQDVLDYCLLHELAGIKVGFGLRNDERLEEISNVLDSCPNALTAQSWLEGNCIRV